MIMRKYLILSVLILYIFQNYSSAQEYNFKTFNTEAGLNDPIVLSILQSKTGFIYVGTSGGFYVFNGQRFKSLSLPNEFTSKTIYKLNYIGQDSLLIGTVSGAALYNHMEINSIPVSENVASLIIFSVYKSNSETLLGTSKGVYQFIDDSLKPYEQFSFLNNMRVYSIVKDKFDSMWFATDSGVYHYSNDKFSQAVTDKKTYKIIITENKYFFLSTVGLFIKEDNKTVHYTTADGLPDNLIYDGIIDSYNNLWLATDYGLGKYDGKSFRIYTREQGLITDKIYTIIQSVEGDYWLGTNHGLVHFPGEKIERFSRDEGIKTTIWKIFEEEENSFLLGSDGNGLLRLKNDKVSKVDLGKYTPTSVWDILVDSKDNLWIATDKGVLKKDKRGITEFSKANKIANDDIFYIFEDSGNNIWFTTYKSGVYKYDGKRTINYNRNNGLNHNTTHLIREDAYKNIWVASERGLNKIKNGRIVPFPGDSALMNSNILTFMLDSRGNLILGTYQRGVLILRINEENKSYTLDQISENEGLNNNSVMFLEIDNRFNLWVGTNKGLNKIDLIEYYSNGKKKVAPYNKWDGFIGVECNQNSSLIDSDNNLWFGTTEGVVKYDLEQIPKYNSPPQYYLESIEINYTPFEMWDDIDYEFIYGNIPYNPILPFEKNTISFNFTAIDFDNPTLISYSYKLEGLDAEYSPFKYITSVTYPSLPPGKYTFLLKGKNRYGIEQNSPLEYPFTVETPFLHSNFFYAIVTFIVFIIALFIYKVKVIDFKKQHKLLQKLYDERLEYEKSLKISQEDYKNLYEHAHDAIIVLDPKTYEIIDINQRTCELYGYEKSELIGKTIDLITVDFQRAKRNIRAFLQIGSTRDLESLHRKKNGDIIEVSINATKMHYKGKDAIVAAHRDISREKEIQRNLILAKESAEKSNKLKTEFLAQISHEIRTPINVILNSVGLIESCIEDPDEEMSFAFRAIRRASDRIIRTIDLILNMSEIQTGTYEPIYESIDLKNDILESLYYENVVRAKDKGIDLLLEINEESLNINGDNYTVIQIFANLIDNAIKYTNEGWVKIRAAKEEASIVVEIIDTGIGIKKDFIPYIFEPFAQEDGGYTRKFDGSGLGMALVKHYCKLNNAAIEIVSEKEKGSTFRVIFPLEKN